MDIQDCTFSGNVASGASDSYGGGIYFSNNNVYLIMQGCIFVNNSAGTGGGICFDSSNWLATLKYMTFRNNIAHTNGGGIALISNNKYMVINFSTFIANEVTARGN